MILALEMLVNKEDFLQIENKKVGGYHYHGKYEMIPLSSMEKAVQVILEINRLNIDSTNKEEYNETKQ